MLAKEKRCDTSWKLKHGSCRVPPLISMPRLALITADPSSRSITSSPSRPLHSSHMGTQNQKDWTSNWSSTSSPKVLPLPFAKLSGAHSTYPWSQTCFRRCCNFVQTKWPPGERHNSGAQKASKSEVHHKLRPCQFDRKNQVSAPTTTLRCNVTWLVVIIMFHYLLDTTKVQAWELVQKRNYWVWPHLYGLKIDLGNRIFWNLICHWTDMMV